VPGELRISDDERERAASALREHFTAGRLTEPELSERIQAVYSARTVKELSEITGDLPRLPATAAQQRAELQARRSELRRRLIQQSGGSLVPFAICTVIWVASGAQGQFRPIWVALVAVIPLLRGGWRLYGPAPELDRIERELDHRRRHELDHQRRSSRAARRDRRRM